MEIGTYHTFPFTQIFEEEPSQMPHDFQGIPWQTSFMPYTRRSLRFTRLGSYRSYRSCTDALDATDDTRNNECKFYEPVFNHTQVHCYNKHFQLRYTIQSQENGEILYYDDRQAAIMSYNPVSKTNSIRAGNVLRNTVSFSCKGGYIVCGGLEGELEIFNNEGKKVVSDNIADPDSTKIINNVKLDWNESRLTLMTCSNDSKIRLFDAPSYRLLRSFSFSSCVNHASFSPCKKMIGAALDDRNVVIVDYDTGEDVFVLKGHRDYSFGVAWHPMNSFLLATCNQDRSAKIWDLRMSSDHVVSPLLTLRCKLGSALNLQFSPNGEYLAFSESADFLHIYETQTFSEEQEIDVFGEIAGFSFSSETMTPERLYLGISDYTYRSLLEYRLSDKSLDKITI
jgi:WD40 repeat protein